MPRCTVLVVLLIASVMEIYSEVINYSCNPAGTITVENPNATFYTGAYAIAVTGDGEVNCSTVSVFGAIIISDCPISENITLWLTDDPAAIIFSGINSAVYKLRCQQIPATGVYRMVTDESWVTNLVSTEHMPSVTPMIILNTDIIDIESGVSRRTAIVGEPLNWEMDGPGGYSILPVNCTARSGDGEQEINIIYNGCSLDLFLVSHFEVNETIGKHYLLSRLYAFRFPTSVEIQITCDMLGCLNTSTACDFTCPSSDPFRRKRSNYENIHTGSLTNIGYADAMEQLNERQPNGFRQAADGTEVLLGQVSLRFNVFDSEDLLISRGVSLVQSWVLLSFGCALSYLLLRI